MSEKSPDMFKIRNQELILTQKTILKEEIAPSNQNPAAKFNGINKFE